MAAPQAARAESGRMEIVVPRGALPDTRWMKAEVIGENPLETSLRTEADRILAARGYTVDRTSTYASCRRLPSAGHARPARASGRRVSGCHVHLRRQGDRLMASPIRWMVFYLAFPRPGLLYHCGTKGDCGTSAGRGHRQWTGVPGQSARPVALPRPLRDPAEYQPAPASPRRHPDRARGFRRAHLPCPDRRRAGLPRRRGRQARARSHPDRRQRRHGPCGRVARRGAGGPSLGRQRGGIPLVIYTSSLLREGAPLATPDPP